eukprot:TRINITY_DN2449_c0_g2_i2.p1 TRINITY_DN2449_c0_g2~~TRINITY_DN2449_c0_g2_i2.p1  ORF type:complete len:297 (-),score=56.92 TRINITY_DN2449_c0_g2_i2:26-916(-)
MKSFFKYKNKKQLELIQITKEGIDELDTFKKQCWIIIISFLDYKDLFVISRVCKTFFLILKENERFWNLFSINTFGANQLNNHYSSWKKFFYCHLIVGWNKERSSPIFEINDKDIKILKTNSKSEWNCCLTKNYLMENFLYPFQINCVSRGYFPIGVATKNTNVKSQDYFACDKYRYGYFFNNSGVYLCNDGKGVEHKWLSGFKNGCTLFIMVHDKSYSQESAMVSFFYQESNSEEKEMNLKYQFTFKGIPLCEDRKLYGFFGCGHPNVTVELFPPIPFNKNIQCKFIDAKTLLED